MSYGEEEVRKLWESLTQKEDQVEHLEEEVAEVKHQL